MEQERLAALQELEIVGTPPSEEFEALVDLARDVFDVPIVLASFMDESRQWFKARRGFDFAEIWRADAFCNTTIQGDAPLVIADASRDERFKENPFVAGHPQVRFYAGVSLNTRGHNVGTFCILDTRPRDFGPGEVEKLRKFGIVAEDLTLAHRRKLELKQALQETSARNDLLARQNQILSQTERMARIAGWQLDLRTETVEWSEGIFRIHEIAPRRHLTLAEAESFYPPSDRARVSDAIAKTVQTGIPFDFEADIITAKGNRRRVRALGEPVFHQGVPVRLVGTVQDITDRHRLNASLDKAAKYDDLTGLSNRKWWQERARKALDQACEEESPFALIMLDLDDFKAVNDIEGHLAGDQLLRRVARCLKECEKAGHIVGRLGGDEFAIAVLGTASAEAVVERIARVLSRVGSARMSPVRMSMTAGIAIRQGQEASLDELLRHADLALYWAKAGRPGRYAVFSQEIGHYFQERHQAMRLVKDALEEGRLVPYYQPQYCLDTGILGGLESLARIRMKDGSIVGPSTFGHVFEDRETSRLIGERMLALVTADIAAWQAAGLRLPRISINAAPADFETGDFGERVLARLAQLGLFPEAVGIEITETVLLGERAGKVTEALSQLHDAGIEISLDDFGTGYASLTHLRTSSVDCVKLDKSFIDGLGFDDARTSIVKSIIELASALHLRTVAEGVENVAQASLLRDMGCRLIQGYLVGQPVEAAIVPAILSAKAGVAAISQ